MILAGHLALPAPGGRLALAPGGIRSEGGRIAEVFELQRGPSADLGGPGCVIFPGFIDAHLHLPQFDSVGVHGRTLLEWLDQVIFPAEARWEDAEYAGAMADRVATELLSFGTTGVCAYATVHEQAARNARHALAARGLRGCVGQVLMDQNAPAALIRPAADLLLQAAAARPEGRIEPIISPRFAVSCSEALLRGCGELATRTGQRVQTHLAETVDECALVARLFGGLDYTEVYRRAGLLRSGAVMAHGIHLDGAARGALARAGTVVAHCPTANLFLQSGAMDRAALCESGVALAMGSDIAGGFERSMVRVARAMVETATRARMANPSTPIPSAAEAFWSITGGNAAALGWAKSGRIEPGADADLLLVRPTIRWMESPDPLGAILWGWDDRWLERVVVAGRVV
ncbi:MAG: amidohydrolase family protein [Phycisphaerales bacterium]